MNLRHLGRFRRPRGGRAHRLDAFFLIFSFRVDNSVDNARVSLWVITDRAAAGLDRFGDLLLLKGMGDLLQLLRTQRLNRVVRVALLNEL